MFRLLPQYVRYPDEPAGGGGGGGTTPPATDPATPGVTGGSFTPPATDPATPATEPKPETTKPDEATNARLTKLESDLKEARDDASKYRTQRAELAKVLAPLLGVELPADGGTPDTKEVAAQVQAVQAEAKALKLQVAFYQMAGPEGVDADLTWGYLLATDALKGIDIDQDDYRDKIKAAVQSATEAKPTLKVSATNGTKTSGGTEIRGGGAGDKTRPEPEPGLQRMSNAYAGKA